MKSATREAIETFAKKAGFHKHATKEIWMENRIPNMKIIDLSIEPPWIGIGASAAQRIEAEDSGIALIQDYKEKILQIYNSSEKHQNEKPPEAGSHIPAPPQEQEVSEPPPSIPVPVSGGEANRSEELPYICAECKTGITATQRTDSVKALGKAFCKACISKKAEQIAEKMKPKEDIKAPEPPKETKKKPAGKKKDTPAPEASKEELICPGCNQPISKCTEQFTYCLARKNNIGIKQGVEPIKPAMCQDCGFELSHIRALEYQICEGCAEKRRVEAEKIVPLKSREKIMNEKTEEPKKPISDKELTDKLEAEEQKKGLAKTQFKVGTCEAVAKQYGIPAELANMFFMTLNEGLYIKNPGLLHLAAKKGYSHIEVTSKYNEKTSEWESESKIFPKVTPEMITSICQLTPELQKIAWDYMTAPTNGTGAASIKSVKMSTMHPFLKEMSQTRAQNRALRAYTGYGGTSLEELPEAELKYIEG